ncbi:MAG TPA: hypothetical protein VK921_10960, partial [Anditalea sp.]|nr:hypothetical protein [Anditalea sp.]
SDKSVHLLKTDKAARLVKAMSRDPIRGLLLPQLLITREAPADHLHHSQQGDHPAEAQTGPQEATIKIKKVPVKPGTFFNEFKVYCTTY